ncbi:MAG: sugar ABC transporter substrate-binding protein [Gemmatimonadota bacterium]
MTRWRSLAVVALLLGEAACAPREESNGIVLRMWAFGREGEVITQIIPEFERENPGVTVKVQQIPWLAAHEKLLTGFVGNTTPDVAPLGNTWIPEFALLNALEPLDTLIARSSGLDSTKFFSGIWATNVVRHAVFGIPWYVDTRVLFYRKDILQRAGYSSMPETWDGWLAAMQAIKRLGGPDRYAVLLPVNEWPPQAILGFQAGSPLVTPSARGVFREAAFERGFTFLVNLYKTGLAPPVSNNEISNIYQEFAKGTFAMLITGPWNLGEFRRRLPSDLQDKWATAPLPGPDGPKTGVSLAGGTSLVVFRRSKHRAESWKLIEFLSRPEQQVKFYRLTGDLPARLEAWTDSTLAGDPEVRAFRTQLERLALHPILPEWEQVTVKLMEATEVAVRGRSPVDSVLIKLDADVDRLLEKRRWILAEESKRAVGATP